MLAIYKENKRASQRKEKAIRCFVTRKGYCLILEKGHIHIQPLEAIL